MRVVFEAACKLRAQAWRGVAEDELSTCLRQRFAMQRLTAAEIENGGLVAGQARQDAARDGACMQQLVPLADIDGMLAVKKGAPAGKIRVVRVSVAHAVAQNHGRAPDAMPSLAQT